MASRKAAGRRCSGARRYLTETTSAGREAARRSQKLWLMFVAGLRRMKPPPWKKRTTGRILAGDEGRKRRREVLRDVFGEDAGGVAGGGGGGGLNVGKSFPAGEGTVGIAGDLEEFVGIHN